jgi:hypothetical protein
MEVDEIYEYAKNNPTYKVHQKITELVRTNNRFRNLNQKNKDLALGLIEKHMDNIRNGIGISAHNLELESYHLYENRLKLGLTLEDLKDIKELLKLFEK